MDKEQTLKHLNKEINKLNVSIDKLIIKGLTQGKKYKDLIVKHSKLYTLINKLSN